MDKVKEITSNSELEIGRYYHCFDRVTISHSIEQCKEASADGRKSLGAGNIWACDDNNQALERWRIYGPIIPCNIGGIYLCRRHGGFGFNSDCQRCKYLHKHKIGES